MDFIISFFRDTLDGGLYYVVVVICLILIMAIIGFIMEKAKIAKEESEKTVVIADATGAPVTNQEAVLNVNTNAATNVTGSVVLTDDDTVSVNTKAKTEEDNFIDFGSTNDDTSNATTSINVNGNANANDNANTNINSGAAVNTNVAMNTNANVATSSVSNVVPGIQQVNSDISNQSAISSTATNVTVTPPVQDVPQVESTIPEIITNVIQASNVTEPVIQNVTSSNAVTSSPTDALTEPELIDLD